MWEAPRSSLAGSVARAGIRQEIKPQGKVTLKDLGGTLWAMPMELYLLGGGRTIRKVGKNSAHLFCYMFYPCRSRPASF